MKLIVLILTTAILQVSANTYAQKVTLSEKNAPLTKIFNQISMQSGFDFLVTKSVLDNAKPVTISVSNAELKDVLKQIFENQPLEYEITDKSVLVREKVPTIFDKIKTAMNIPVTISGKVVDETGQPMAGVTVMQKLTTNVTVTDAKGIFSLSVPDDKAVVVFSFVGFETQESVAKDINKRAVITMKATSTSLKEVVINKGYYSTTQLLNTGNVSKIISEQISKQPVGNFLSVLEGQVPGLQIIQNSGLPGKSVTVLLRGKNSISNGTLPLYIIDGVPFYNGTRLSNNFVISASYGDSPLNSINPSDIESIEILKDADATAIYGSRGANGVILITTKKGKAGKTKIDFNTYSGISKASTLPKLLNTQQYLKMLHEAYKNDGTSPQPGDYAIDGTWDSTRYTNWPKLLVGNSAYINDAQLSVSGGSSLTQFLIGGGYHRETTVYPGNFSDQRGSMHGSITHSSENKKLHIDFSFLYSQDFNKLPVQDPSSYAFLPPDSPSIYNGEGKLNWENSTWFNPYALLLQTGKSENDYLNANYDVSYKIADALSFKTNFGFTTTNFAQGNYIPLSSYDPVYIPNVQANSATAQNKITSWNIEPQLNYNKKLGPGTLDVLLGATFLQQRQQATAYNALGFSSDALIYDIQAASNVTVKQYSNNLYRYDALFARINYNIDDKYLINLTGRRDGSSRFGPDKQYGDFGAIGLAWIFSREKFIKNAIPILSSGKIRMSYGTSGNDQIGDYQYLNSFSPYTANAGATYMGVGTLYPSRLFNPDYGWEINKKLEIALDLGFFDDRIFLNVSGFRNRSGSQLQQIPLPAITGATSITANLPAVVQNQGLEFSLNTTNVKSKNFTWSTAVNLTIPENKLISYPGLAKSSVANIYVIGQSLSIAKVLHYTGLDTQNGVYTFQDSNKDGQITFPNDYQKVLFTGQQFYGGISNSFQYKQFQLSFFLQFVEQKHVLNYYLNGYIGDLSNQLQYIYNNHWTTPGQNAKVQKFSTGNDGVSADAYNNFSNSDGLYQNGSYLRLKNVALSYSFPSVTVSKLGLRQLRIYVQGQNLLTFTKYIGVDPETQTANPVLRTFTAGVQVSF